MPGTCSNKPNHISATTTSPEKPYGRWGCPPDGHARLPFSPTGQGGCRHRPRWLSLNTPVRSIAEGDGFTIRAGCDKRMETCGAKFANTANFRGFPHIPGQDAVLRYATKDGGHEGSVL